MPLGPTVRHRDIDGLAIRDGRVYLGTDEFLGSKVQWTTRSTEGTAWTTVIHRPAGDWNEQGDLFTARQNVLALRFSQRPTAAGLQATVVLEEATPNGRWRQVGPDVLQPGVIHGPISLDAVQLGRDVYVLSTRTALPSGPDTPVLLHLRLVQQQSRRP